ncbi:hypothetical protein N0V83_002753 [Neocucurbitaria cava]|uniref:Uncharacterized protein n=1 Tax=Neocucurbitaria cava TaxID=798079 RepID=A0A9W9CPY2_9PLEO|nr:hypothetical protein N0V83_002753 [Neocucurbitaria cava]
MNANQENATTDTTSFKRKDSGVGSRDVDHQNFGNPIDNKRPATREEWQQAVSFLHGKLSKVASGLNALVEIDLTGENPHVFVDTRGDTPAIFESCPEDGVPNVKLRMRPLTMLHFGEGLMDTRYASHFNQIQSTGDARLGVNATFGNLATASSKTPSPPSQLSALQTRLKDQAAGEVAAGVSYSDGGPKKPNQRIWNLPNKGQEFLDLLEHPLVEDFMPDFLGDGYHLSSYTANINRPGSKGMGMHTDQITINPAIPQFPLGLNLMWFLTDVNEENGGTRILPKSHNGLVAPDNMFDIAGTMFASGPAGTCLVFESRLWHATGPNVAKEGEGERPVILQFYVRHFVRPQENFTLSVDEEVRGEVE